MSASIKCSNFIMNSFHIIWEQLKQKGWSDRHEVYAKDTPAKADGQSGNGTSSSCDRIGGNMDCSLNKRKMKQCNRKIFCFAFVVYWRHYG